VIPPKGIETKMTKNEMKKLKMGKSNEVRLFHGSTYALFHFC